MKTRTAVVRQAPGKYEVVAVDLADPEPGEIQVRMVAAGLCHSDDHIATGDLPVAVYPFAGGHEGAGVVVGVGPNTRGFAEGDHVVFSFLPGCGRCRWCASGMQNLCDLGATLLLGSRFHDPSSFRMHLDGVPVGQMAGLATFSEYTTVDVNSAVRIPRDVPLDKACLLGCGVGTGWGSAVNSAGVQVGDTVIVMGVGGVGINAVQGAAHAGAAHVLAVDPVGFKRELAEQLGATHSFSGIEEAAEVARQLTNGQGADSAVVAVGVTTGEHVGQAFTAIRKAGTVVVTGIGSSTEMAPPISLMDLTLSQKRLQGSLFGACSPSKDIPRQLELYQAGRLKLDELITRTYTLDEVAQGYEDMHAGKLVRGVIVLD
ncbi:NDMA-dependent alcohol dehydrogenase [Pseudonocardia spinosispora]|uniref:NDMA-dependent alcohol dehydrogenase n=1 Tax=Pseudonocardia spinosispora TaxID=103441 RepID=UPI000428E2F3|nr:NDMA-dependent alcohol dehydrogenase [Pseudonocardia spinosispora]